jgi:hypothetical protein
LLKDSSVTPLSLARSLNMSPAQTYRNPKAVANAFAYVDLPVPWGPLTVITKAFALLLRTDFAVIAVQAHSKHPNPSRKTRQSHLVMPVVTAVEERKSTKKNENSPALASIPQDEQLDRRRFDADNDVIYEKANPHALKKLSTTLW